MTESYNLLEAISGGLSPVLVGTWLVMAVMIVFAAVARRRLEATPEPLIPDDKVTLRSIAEVMVEQVDKFVADVMENHRSRTLVPFIGSLFFFILFCNFLGLIPGMEPPTAYSDLTFALGTVSFGYYLYQGFRSRGAAYLKSFLGPLAVLAPLMLPIEIADNLFRPFSLGVRLHANMFADHQVLGVFTGLTKVIVPLAFYALGSIVAVIQALVFAVLSLSYVKMATGAEH